MQINKNPELFSPFLPFFGLNNLLPHTRMKYFGLQAFRLCAEKSYIIRLVNSKRGKKRFVIQDVLIVLGSRA